MSNDDQKERTATNAIVSVPFSSGEYLLYQAEERPLAVFVADHIEGGSVTYRDMSLHAASVAAALSRKGVVQGDRVVLLAENGWRWIAAFFGIQMGGAICTPVNTRLGETDMPRYIQDAEPALVLGEPNYLARLPRGYRGRGVSLREMLPDIRPIGDSEPSDPGRREAVGVIAYTSGTTGNPKGVMLPQKAVAGSGAIMAGVFNSGPWSKTPIFVPLFHNTGFVDAVMHMCVVGGQVEVHARFKPEELRDALLVRRASFFVGVPTMYVRLLRLMEGEVHTEPSPWLCYGGAGMTAASIERLRRVLPTARLVNAYGLSEATSLTHYLPWLVAEGRWDAVGIPVPGTSDRLSDPGGSEIEIRSPNVMSGYWNKPDATAEKLIGDGWLRTGDLGMRDDAGMLRIIGRTDDIINRGGEKIAPFEVESALMEHRDVSEVIVIGIPDAELGQALAAVYVARPGRQPSDDDLRDHLLGLLADYKVPKYMRRVDFLPRNSHGKIARLQVEQESIQVLT